MPAPIETGSFIIEHLGPWRPEDISVHFDRTPFRPPGDREPLIERIWNEQQADSRRHGFEMFNGKLARLASSSSFNRDTESRRRRDAGERAEQRPRLELALQPTDFRTFLATNLIAPEQFAPADRANAMGVSAIVRASDSRLVFGRRSQRVAYNRGKLHTVGGVLDWMRPAGGASADGGWVLDQLVKELFEELAVAPEDIRQITPLAMARDRRVWQPELLCLTEVGVTGNELSARWRASGEYEHEDLWGCHDSPKALNEALTRHAGEFTPVGLAACVAYMAIRYGETGLAAMGGA